MLPYRSSTRRWTAAVLALLLLCAPVLDVPLAAESDRAQKRHRRLDKYLQAVAAAAHAGPQRVIVRTRPGSRRAMRRSLARQGKAVLAEHASLDALTVVVDGDDLQALAGRPDVLSVSTDAVVSAHGGQLLGGLLGAVGGLLGGTVQTATGLLGGLVGGLVGVVGGILDPATSTEGPAVPPRTLRETLGVPGSLSGRGVGVAVIDSGLEMSSEFYDSVTAFYDFTNGQTRPAYPSDPYGHGTHVAGTIAGSGSRSSNREYRGLAPDVKLVIFKVLDEHGAGYTSDVIRAIDFAVAYRQSLGIDIINLSLGHPIYEPAATDPLVQAVERASQAGIIVVAAAGNLGTHPETGVRGYAGITSPGNAPSAITIGALQTLDTAKRSDDRIPDYSSAGPTWYDGLVKPDIVAPGHNIVAVGARRSALYQNYPQLRAEDADYMKLSGTSMATAVASGVIALMLEAHDDDAAYNAPPLTPNSVKAVLQYTAFGVRNELGLEYDTLRQGAGALNGKGAIQLGRSIETRVQPGMPWLTAVPYPYTTISGESNAWKQAIVWGDAIVWGSTVDVRQTAWGQAIVWGSDTTWGSAIVWGSNLVWDDPSTWSNAIVWGSTMIGTTDGTAIVWGSTNGMTEANTVWQDLSQ